MPVYSLGNRGPKIHANAYVAAEAIVIGDVTISEGASVWPGAIIRGDNESISIGPNTNIQDGAIIHADPGFPTTIGSNVSVGHQAVLHGCTIGSTCLIGIQSVVLNGAIINDESLVGAGALVTEGKTFPPRSLIVGTPAKPIREMSDEAVKKIAENATEYTNRAVQYSNNLVKIAWGLPLL
jgi:carbonic anhydrase/acetyltransferase-like protein (isoleucine patch superfamily)